MHSELVWRTFTLHTSGIGHISVYTPIRVFADYLFKSDSDSAISASTEFIILAKWMDNMAFYVKIIHYYKDYLLISMLF